MIRWLISDLHLDRTTPRRMAAFERFLARAAGACEELYILGDLVEAWVGDDDDGPFARALTACLAEATRRQHVFLMHGNRDFLIGPGFEARTGVRLLQDPHTLDADTVLSHGDGLCTDDHAYQQMRALFRSEAWQSEILERPLEARRALADSMREQSRANNGNKPDNIMDVNAEAAAALMHERGATRLIHGHTHRPGVHRLAWGTRYVLGDWLRCGWQVVLSDNEPPALQAFRLAP